LNSCHNIEPRTESTCYGRRRIHRSEGVEGAAVEGVIVVVASATAPLAYTGTGSEPAKFVADDCVCHELGSEPVVFYLQVVLDAFKLNDAQ